jgi:AraC-like DNA-binding protein
LIIHELKANDFLKNFIYSFTHIRTNSKNKSLFIYPDGADYLLFSKDEIKSLDKTEVQSKYQLNLKQNQEYFLVRFKPFTLYYLQKQKEKYENVLKIIHKNISTSNSLTIKKTSISLLIMELLDVTFLENHITNIFNLILESKGNITVEQISLQTNIHPKKLQRDFKTILGVTPKQFISIIKFQNAISIFYSSINSVKIIKTDPYYDYSHHSKIFNKYLRMTPKNFIHTKETHLRSIFNL